MGILTLPSPGLYLPDMICYGWLGLCCAHSFARGVLTRRVAISSENGPRAEIIGMLIRVMRDTCTGFLLSKYYGRISV